MKRACRSEDRVGEGPTGVTIPACASQPPTGPATSAVPAIAISTTPTGRTNERTEVLGRVPDRAAIASAMPKGSPTHHVARTPRDSRRVGSVVSNLDVADREYSTQTRAPAWSCRIPYATAAPTPTGRFHRLHPDAPHAWPWDRGPRTSNLRVRRRRGRRRTGTSTPGDRAPGTTTAIGRRGRCRSPGLRRRATRSSIPSSPPTSDAGPIHLVAVRLLRAPFPRAVVGHRRPTSPARRPSSVRQTPAACPSKSMETTPAAISAVGWSRVATAAQQTSSKTNHPQQYEPDEVQRAWRDRDQSNDRRQGEQRESHLGTSLVTFASFETRRDPE